MAHSDRSSRQCLARSEVWLQPLQVTRSINDNSRCVVTRSDNSSTAHALMQCAAEPVLLVTLRMESSNKRDPDVSYLNVRVPPLSRTSGSAASSRGEACAIKPALGVSVRFSSKETWGLSLRTAAKKAQSIELTHSSAAVCCT